MTPSMIALTPRRAGSLIRGAIEAEDVEELRAILECIPDKEWLSNEAGGVPLINRALEANDPALTILLLKAGTDLRGPLEASGEESVRVSDTSEIPRASSPSFWDVIFKPFSELAGEEDAKQLEKLEALMASVDPQSIPLDKAVRASPELLRCVLKAQSDVNEWSLNQEGRSLLERLLHQVREMSLPSNKHLGNSDDLLLPRLKVMLEEGFSLEGKENSGRPHWDIWTEYSALTLEIGRALVELLTDNGVDLNRTDQNGSNFLLLRKKSSWKQFFWEDHFLYHDLLKQGVDPLHKNNKGRSFFEDLCELDFDLWDDMQEDLMEATKTVEDRQFLLNRMLFKAIDGAYLESVVGLLEKGADPESLMTPDEKGEWWLSSDSFYPKAEQREGGSIFEIVTAMRVYREKKQLTSQTSISGVGRSRPVKKRL